MQTTTLQQRSLVGGLRNGLVAPISLLLLGLILCVSAGIFASVSQYNLGEQKVAIQENLDGMLRSMVDQETGIRGYINTNNPTFLEPFNSGRPQYLSYLDQLKKSTNNASFSNTSALIVTADSRASDWYNNFALVQLKNMEAGNLTTARAERTSAEGKVAFDAFRTAMGQLQGVVNVYPMNENARNVLNVVASNLTAALSNTQAYRHIQEQAEELEKRSREQEAANIALRRQRDDLTVLNVALEDANKARSQFLSTMSHELRTPLTSIIGFSQILLRTSDSASFNQRQRGNIERILKNGQHLLSLINDVLDLAKIEAGRIDINNSDVNVPELLAAVVEETHSIAVERKLNLQWRVEEGVSHIETDPIKLRQIVLNLISNALKFTEKGSVTVTARRIASLVPADVTPDITESGYNNDVDQIAISVQDTGIGISQEMQERIFEAFYQVDGSNTRKYGGTGLGLSIVRQLTALLGGKLELQSTLDKGSTFTLYLRCHTEFCVTVNYKKPRS